MAAGLFQTQLEASIKNRDAKGIQAWISLRGECVFDFALGEARPGIPIRDDTTVLWMSAGKPVTAVAIATLVDKGQLDWDDPVAEWVPGFEANGKESITVRQVLMHTGGFRAAPVEYPADDWPAIQSKVAAARLEPGWVPGDRAGYHVHTGWWALGAVTEAASGQTFSSYIRAEVLEPLGMSRSWITMPPEVYDRLREQGTFAEMSDTSSGSGADESWTSNGTETRAWCTNVRPGGNAYGPAADLARFYRMMLDDPQGPDEVAGSLNGITLLQPDTARDLIRRHRNGMMDRTFRHVMDWGLGFMLDSKHHHTPEMTPPYGYGPHASRDAFGHGGSQCSVAFADPQHGLAGAILWNGQPGEPAHQQRLHQTLAALYEDLGLS